MSDNPTPTLKRRDPMARDLTNTPLEGYRELGEVATRFNRHPRTIKRWCLQGLRHIRIAGALFIHDRDIVSFFEANAVGGNTPRGR